MIKTIRARFSKGVIKPLDKVDIEEGRELVITIQEIRTPFQKEGFLFGQRRELERSD